MSKAKKLAAIVMSIMMALSLTVPALATDGDDDVQNSTNVTYDAETNSVGAVLDVIYDDGDKVIYYADLGKTPITFCYEDGTAAYGAGDAVGISIMISYWRALGIYQPTLYVEVDSAYSISYLYTPQVSFNGSLGYYVQSDVSNSKSSGFGWKAPLVANFNGLPTDITGTQTAWFESGTIKTTNGLTGTFPNYWGQFDIK